MSKFEVKEKGKWPHYCSKPGPIRRTLLRLKTGAVIQCKECGAKYMFEYRSYDGEPTWRRI